MRRWGDLLARKLLSEVVFLLMDVITIVIYLVGSLVDESFYSFSSVWYGILCFHAYTLSTFYSRYLCFLRCSSSLSYQFGSILLSTVPVAISPRSLWSSESIKRSSLILHIIIFIHQLFALLSRIYISVAYSSTRISQAGQHLMYIMLLCCPMQDGLNAVLDVSHGVISPATSVLQLLRSDWRYLGCSPARKARGKFENRTLGVYYL